MKNKNFIKDFLSWLFEGKFLFISLAIFIIGLNLDKFLNNFTLIDKIRIYGLVLQLIGASTIIIQLKNKLIFFKDFGILQFFIQYFKRFPIGKKQRIGNLKGVSIGSSKVRSRLQRKPNLESIEEVIEYINQQTRILKEKISLLNSRIGDLEENIENSKREMKNSLEKTEKMISESAVSDIWIELFGVFSIFVGLIFGTIPKIVESFLYL